MNHLPPTKVDGWEKRKETKRENETQFIFLVPTALFSRLALRVERLHHVSSQKHLHSSHAR
jgi:hypothetical protein